MKDIQSHEFILGQFSQYYQRNSSDIEPPLSIEEREFAFFLIKDRVMLRHKGFKDVSTLRDFVKTISPSDVYYSSAYYHYPEEEMTAKGWIGADLIFDIDADHIPTICSRQHDTWTCKSCGSSDRGLKPERCPNCKGEKFSSTNWLCEVCLESAKRETIKLVEILESDFGFSPQEITIAFSGHRGYHVHIEKEVIRTLDAMSRKEIVDYLLGIGLKPSLHGFDLENALGPNLEDPGWRGRIAKGVFEVLVSSPEYLQKEGLSRISKDLKEQKDLIVERWKRKGPWGLIKGIGSEGWERIIAQAVEEQSVKIDTVVTTDIHRLIRLANTLHGETGLKKIEVPLSEIEKFDPLKEAVAFKEGMIRLLVSEAPEFRLGDVRYGPFKNAEVELPTAAALFLLCKGAARLKETN